MTILEAFNACADRSSLYCRPISWRGQGIAVSVWRDNEDDREPIAQAVIAKLDKGKGLYSVILKTDWCSDIPVSWLSAGEWEVIYQSELEYYTPAIELDMEKFLTEAGRAKQVEQT